MLILATSAYGIIAAFFLIYTVLYFNFPCNEQNSLFETKKLLKNKLKNY